MRFFTGALLLLSVCASAQGIKIEYNKKHDFSKYKTFAFGESQVITPADQKQVSDATVDSWVKNGVTRELEFKGLKKTDSLPDLVVTYVIGTMERSDAQAIGPLGMTPGSDARSWSRDYKQTSIIVDLNNRNRYLVWRVNAVIDAIGTDAEKTIDMAIVRGFKKYPKLKN